MRVPKRSKLIKALALELAECHGCLLKATCESYSTELPQSYDSLVELIEHVELAKNLIVELIEEEADSKV